MPQYEERTPWAMTLDSRSSWTADAIAANVASTILSSRNSAAISTPGPGCRLLTNSTFSCDIARAVSRRVGFFRWVTTRALRPRCAKSPQPEVATASIPWPLQRGASTTDADGQRQGRAETGRVRVRHVPGDLARRG